MTSRQVRRWQLEYLEVLNEAFVAVGFCRQFGRASNVRFERNSNILFELKRLSYIWSTHVKI